MIKSNSDLAVRYNDTVYCYICIPHDALTKQISIISPYEELQAAPICNACGEIHDYMFIKDRPGDDEGEPCDRCNELFHDKQYVCPHCNFDNNSEDDEDDISIIESCYKTIKSIVLGFINKDSA